MAPQPQWVRLRLKAVQPRETMPVRCGGHLRRALTMLNKFLKTIRKHWRRALNLLCQQIVQVRAKELLPTDHLPISLVIRSSVAFNHPRNQVLNQLQTIFPTRSTNKPKKMLSRQKDSQMQEWATLAQPQVNIQRLKHSFRLLPCKSTKKDS